jgi:protein-tyrosine phosphatase
MIDQRADLFGQIFRRWLQPDQLPMAFHCTAGKDRTGVTAMLLLGMLGVSDELIVADYTLSNYAHESLKQSLMQNSGALKMLRLSASDLVPLLLAHPDTMRRTIEHVHQRYGGYAAYLTKQAGLSEAELDQLRASLLE